MNLHGGKLQQTQLLGLVAHPPGNVDAAAAVAAAALTRHAI